MLRLPPASGKNFRKHQKNSCREHSLIRREILLAQSALPSWLPSPYGPCGLSLTRSQQAPCARRLKREISSSFPKQIMGSMYRSALPIFISTARSRREEAYLYFPAKTWISPMRTPPISTSFLGKNSLSKD